jgi:hypothetical protein
MGFFPTSLCTPQVTLPLTISVMSPCGTEPDCLAQCVVVSYTGVELPFLPQSRTIVPRLLVHCSTCPYPTTANGTIGSALGQPTELMPWLFLAANDNFAAGKLDNGTILCRLWLSLVPSSYSPSIAGKLCIVLKAMIPRGEILPPPSVSSITSAMCPYPEIVKRACDRCRKRKIKVKV